MKTLVLDKSALRAASAEELRLLQNDFEFLLTDTLLYEIASEGLGESLSESEIRKLNRRIEANLRKAIEQTSNLWLEKETAARWEIKRGCSARSAPRSGRSIPSPLIPRELIEPMQEDERNIAHMASVSHPQEHHAAFCGLRRLASTGENALFERMASLLSSPTTIERISNEAKKRYTEIALCLGIMVSPDFAPRRDWFTFGVEAANWLYIAWKLAKYGDGPPGLKKPANPLFDMSYIAYMAIADGVLSCDRELLKLAWACWPEKRGDLYAIAYDQATGEHSLQPFVPKFVSDSEKEV